MLYACVGNNCVNNHAPGANHTWCQKVQQSRPASYNTLLSPLAAFPFDIPDVWQKWRCKFEQYCAASASVFAQRISGVPSQHNVIFLGEEVEDILELTGISDEHQKDYSQFSIILTLSFALERMFELSA